MKKEVIIAILVGLSMGLIITFGVYRVSSKISEPPETNLTEENTDAEATASAAVIALHSPEDGTVQTETEQTVTGTTTPDSFIVLFVNDQDYISNSDESGNFSFKVELEDGANILRVHVLDAEGNATVEERLVVVSDAFEKAAESENADNTDNSDENTNETAQ